MPPITHADLCDRLIAKKRELGLLLQKHLQEYNNALLLQERERIQRNLIDPLTRQLEALSEQIAQEGCPLSPESLPKRCVEEFNSSVYGHVMIGGGICEKWRQTASLPHPSGGSIQNYLGVPTRSPVGFPRAEVLFLERGMIVYIQVLGSFVVYGAIYGHYQELGGVEGFLGLPLSDELPAPDGGRLSVFQNGNIYWRSDIGAHEVHGAIRDHYLQNTFLGYPVTDETPTPDGVGRFNHFEHGSIYWTPQTGAHEVHGAIRDKWASLGWEGSFLGYPVTDETPTPDGVGRFSNFQRGRILWFPSTGTDVVPEKVVFRSSEVGELRAKGVYGWVELGLSSDGFYSFRGHLHNDDFISYNYAIGMVLDWKDSAGKGIGFKQDGVLGGTVNPLDSRNEDWQQDGHDPLIMQNWDAIKGAGFEAKLHVDSGAFPVWEVVFLPLASVLAVVGVIFLGHEVGARCEWEPRPTPDGDGIDLFRCSFGRPSGT